MEKSPEAFRTIREVADGMDLPQHVLRFWETRFPQIRPLKRAGGRRYYRPDDVERLRLIKRLLYDEGYTIKGVQKLFREQGAQHLVHALPDRRPSPGPTPDSPPTAPASTTADDLFPETEGRDDVDYEPDPIPTAPSGPVLAPQDVDALRDALASLREAQRILARAR